MRYCVQNADFAFCVFSNPSVQVHTGGQLGTPRCDISGWSRSNIGVDLWVRCPALGPLRSTSPISWSVLPQCRSSTAYISRQKAASLIESSPMYSAPACSIIRKQLYSVYPPAASADLAIRRTNWSKANRLPLDRSRRQRRTISRYDKVTQGGL
jgi:hypothetical protein